MFSSWTQWHWVALAWLHLIGSYVAYEAYLRWRQRKLEEDASSNEK